MAELPLEVLKGSRGILNGVMQPGSSDYLVIVRNHGDKIGNSFEVHVIGLKGVFAQMVDAGVGIDGVVTRSGGKFPHNHAP
jgi:hypothetical protein